LKRPLLVGAISYIIGILWGLYFFEISIVLIFCVSVFFVFNKFKINKLTVILVVVAILVGFFYMAYSNKYYINKITNLKQSTNWIEVQIISITKEHDYTNSYEARFKDRGMFLKDLILGFSPDEKVVNVFEENNNFFKKTLIFFTKNGMVKLTNGAEFEFNKQVISAIKLKDDEVINIEEFDNKKNLMFITKLASIEYQDTPYLSPLSPFNLEAQKNAIIKYEKTKIKKRPSYLHTKNTKKVGEEWKKY